jgi:(1->4)-alpha-D-glucan 1-alpha-D-glucosylmutase
MLPKVKSALLRQTLYNDEPSCMIATYRLQLRPRFDFSDARELVPYLADLGVSHLYLSPIMQARDGSTHGYDVIDHNAVSDDLGGREGFERLREAAVEHDLGLVLDFVPNHAGVGPHNAYWQELLAYGPHAESARYFDVDWQPLKPELEGKVLLPFLGDPYGDVLDDGELGLRYDDGRLYATYYEHRFALSPHTYAEALQPILNEHERADAYWDLKELADAYESLEAGERDKAEALRPRFQQIAERIDLSVLEETAPADLHDLLERQHWRLAYWRTAGSEINYRRFFTINDLVALRMEDPEVFWDAHRLLGELLAEDGVAGVRIDHIDGLFAPHEYLERLRELGAGRVWVEKILARGETLPEGWPVDGTTGYIFMNDAMNVLLRPDAEPVLNRVYRRYADDAAPYAEVAYASKTLVMERALSSELARLANEADRITEADYHTRDVTLDAFREALREITAASKRYRTYLPHDEAEAEEILREVIHRARNRSTAEPFVYDIIIDVLFGEVADEVETLRRAWTGRFQQYTAPVAAKGIEDTAFYRYQRLAALNEVGGEPDAFGITPEAFHARARFRAREYPRNLLATSTHDHKRGAATRMRLIALAEMPERWEETVDRLSEIAEEHRGRHGPAPSDEYLFFQTLAALWPDAERTNLTERLTDYVQKAAREAKKRTTWARPDDDYESDLDDFVRGVISDERTAGALDPFAEDLAEYGFFNGITQRVLKLTSPGVPDIYQGAELPDLSLVDPDNRRPVDYRKRRGLLGEHEALIREPSAGAVRALLDDRAPAAHFYVTARLLRVRSEHAALFADGDYQGLAPEKSDHHLAFARTYDGDALIVVAGRFPASYDEHAGATIPLPKALHGRTWRDVLTGERVAGGEALRAADWPLPWAVLIG